MYTLKRIRLEFLSEIQYLYLKCFNIKVLVEQLIDKYETNGFGKSYIGYIAHHANKDIAAYYGVFPIKMNYEGKEILVAQSGDTMTHPEHQKRGLFIELATKTYQLSREEGISFIFGFPNENSFPGFKNKLNWIFTGEMKKFGIRNFTIPFCEIANRYSVFQPMYRIFFNLILSRFKVNPTSENICHFAANSNLNYIIKDLTFFQYKLKNENNHFVEFRGFKLLIKTKGHLIIGDVAYFPHSKFLEFLSAIKLLGVILMAYKTILTLSVNHWLFRYLVGEFKPSKSLPIGFYKLNDENVIFENIIFSHADFDTF